MSIQFYFAPMTSSMRVHWALEEVGVPYEKIKVSLAEKEQKKPEYLMLNPNGKVPLLVVDGRPIFESLAQLLYLGETHGKDVFPPPGLHRAEAFKWMAWSYVTMGESLARYMRNTTERFPHDEKNEKAGASARKELEEQLGMLDAALAGKEWILGSFTLADIACVGFPLFMQMRLGFDMSPYPNVAGLITRTMARPAFQRSMMG
jgi:glutathione S-transferase